jgi:hypothetical protein
MIHGLYTLEEASQLSGLKLNTLKLYSHGGNSTLVRGRDFTTLRRYRFGRCQHKTVFTKQGVERLIARDYAAIKPADRETPPKAREIIARLHREARGINPGSPNTIEGKLRRRQLRMIRLAVHVEKYPCRNVGCLCLCHSLADGIYPVQIDARTSISNIPSEAIKRGDAEAVFVAHKEQQKDG